MLSRILLDAHISPIYVLYKGDVLWEGLYGCDFFQAKNMNPGWGYRIEKYHWIHFEDFFEFLDWMDDRMRLEKCLKPVYC